MAEYLPIHLPGDLVTLKASATITAGQVVGVTGSGTVGPAGADSAVMVGVATQDAVANDNITISCGGTQSVKAAGAITAGDAIECAAAGAVATASGGTVLTVIGVALTTAADAAQVRVRFNR